MRVRSYFQCLSLSAAVLANACGGVKLFGAKTANSSDSNRPASSTTIKPSGDPKEDVKQAFLKLNSAKCWRAVLTTSGGRAMQIEFVAPDRFHIKNPSNVEGERASPEMIIIGKETYMKMGNMPWRHAPQGAGFGEIIQEARRTDVAEEMARYEEIKFAGSEDLDGVPALVYRFKRKDENGHESSGKIWIAASDGVLRKIEKEGTGADAAGAGTTVVYSEYNGNIKIEPPV